MIAPSLCERGDAKIAAILNGTKENACRLRKLVLGLSTLPDHPDSSRVIAIWLGKLFPFLSEVVGSEREDWGNVEENIRRLPQTLRTKDHHHSERPTSKSPDCIHKPAIPVFPFPIFKTLHRRFRFRDYLK